MPPKKDKGKGDDDKIGHTNFMLKNQILSLEHQLANEQERADRSKTNELELQKRIITLDSEFTQQKDKLRQVTDKMSIQYKRVQGEYQKQVEQLEKDVEEEDQAIKKMDQLIVDTKKDHEYKMGEKDKEINDLKRKIEEMSQEFAKMLRDTLDKMQQRIELVQWDNDSDPTLGKKMQDITGLDKQN